MKEPIHAYNAVATMVASSAPLKWATAALGAVVAYVLPTGALVDMAIASGVFIALDTLTGMMASKEEGEPISSAKFSRLLTKLIGYSVVVIVASLAARNIPGFGELAPAATGAVLTLTITTEGISILENLDRMGVKFPRFISDALKGQQE